MHDRQTTQSLVKCGGSRRLLAAMCLVVIVFMLPYCESRVMFASREDENPKTLTENLRGNTCNLKKFTGGEKLSTINFRAVLDRVLNEFSSFQNDVQCLKMMLNSSPKLMKVATENGRANPSGKQQFKNPYTSDVVTEEDDRDHVQRSERNYYGWMDFGK